MIVFNKGGGITARKACKAFVDASPKLRRLVEVSGEPRRERLRRNLVRSKRQSPHLKIGHLGTLDPMATGVMLLLYEKATRLADYIPVEPKRYFATVQLGQETDSGDAHGKVVAAGPSDWKMPGDFESVCASFVGSITQIPPPYSAIWINGERAYSIARRRGVEHVKVPPRQVRIDGLRASYDENLGQIRLDVTCGSGTYIRTIGMDLARKLGTVGHLCALHRKSLGPFTLDSSDEQAYVHYGLEELVENFVAPNKIHLDRSTPPEHIAIADTRKMNHLKYLRLPKDVGLYSVYSDGKLVWLVKLIEREPHNKFKVLINFVT